MKILIEHKVSDKLPEINNKDYHVIFDNKPDVMYYNKGIFTISNWLGDDEIYKPTSWYEEVEIDDLDSTKILPIEERIKEDVLSDEFVYVKKEDYNKAIKALEAAELQCKLLYEQNKIETCEYAGNIQQANEQIEGYIGTIDILENKLKELNEQYNCCKEICDRRKEQLDIADEVIENLKTQLGEGLTKEFYRNQIIELNNKNKELEELLQIAHEKYTKWYFDMCDKYADISWMVEDIYKHNALEDGVSNGKARELVRELLDKKADERYEKALELANKHFKVDDKRTLNNKIINILKTAVYGTSR
jgi:chromosome segregation ATPase